MINAFECKQSIAIDDQLCRGVKFDMIRDLEYNNAK